MDYVLSYIIRLPENLQVTLYIYFAENVVIVSKSYFTNQMAMFYLYKRLDVVQGKYRVAS